MNAAATILPRLVAAVDVLDRDTVRGLLSDEIAVDYSELSGEPAATVPADVLIDQWWTMLPGFEATQHLLGPVVVDGNRLGAHVRAWHYLPDAVWMVAGHYRAGVASDGRLDALTLQVFRVEGPADAAERAVARAASDPRP